MIPLPIYPGLPSSEVMGMIKEAKARVGTNTLVKPVRAVKGSPGRILAIGKSRNGYVSTLMLRIPAPNHSRRRSSGY